jgi:hypothetical protein
MKRIGKTAGVVLISVIVIVSGVMNGYAENKAMRELDKKIEKANTPEKREAIAHVRDLFKEYHRHFAAMEIVDDILAADRNIPILSKLADYAIRQGSATSVYISIAEQASKAPLADREFLQLAELVKKNDTGVARFTDLACQAAQANTDADLKEVRKKIAAMR